MEHLKLVLIKLKNIQMINNIMECIKVLLLLVCNLIMYTWASGRYVIKTLSVNNTTPIFGSWHGPQYCASDMYAKGFQLKVEQWRDKGDYSGLNAIKLFCGDLGDFNKFGGYITSAEARDGQYYEIKNCNDGDFLQAFELNVQEYQHSFDDASAINVKFWCRSYYGGSEYELNYPFLGTHESRIGQWTGCSGSCPSNSAICGMRVKIDDNGHVGLVNAEFYCCSGQ